MKKGQAPKSPQDEEIMLDWLQRQSWSLEAVLAVAGVVATIAVAVIAPLRRWLAKLVRSGLLRSGRPERRYARWFVEKWGVYDNPYLAEAEKLDLSSTYVSLSFRAADSRQETRTVATEVLADRTSGNLVIEGGPGSGKSTLLKAYGVGTLKLQHRLRWLHVRQGDIPFFVQLRKFAQRLDRSDGGGLAKYIVDDILVSGAGMPRQDATDFLLHALSSGRALVMLDGLDEVPNDRQAAVKEAVYLFKTDRNPAAPSRLARLIVTCRRQNFIGLRDEWVPVVARKVCTLAPLRNSEIFGYLDKLRAHFKTQDGPESFFQAVRVSGTLELHRIPLILAMSVGLYARKDFVEIPNSIAKLYRTMIEEMLDRQRFKRDPGGGVLAFKVEDKHRFLREFAFHAATGPHGFGDFDRDDLVGFARPLAPALDAVTDPGALVTEIVDRSGLLTDVSEAGRFVFAHRSIHEYLVAEELLLLPDGGSALLERATDPEWRQVVLFYATALQQRGADAFLSELAGRNVTLAGHCLAGAKPSNDVATVILDSLRTADPVHVAALVAATMSPRRPIQEKAVAQLETQLLRSMDEVVAAFSGEVDGMLPLLGSLAGSNAARIAALVPEIVANIPDDPRLVEPLWRCLAAPGIEQQPACRTIVERLLTIAVDPDGFEELQRQEPYVRPFLTGPVRARAYPFEDGLPRTSNLVTLLAWSDKLGVAPAQANRFFEAKAAGRLASVERDERRTVSFSLFWPARIVNAAATVLSVAAVGAVLFYDWHVLLRPFGWWWPLLALAWVSVPLFAIVVLVGWAGQRPKDSWAYHHLNAETNNAHIAPESISFGMQAVLVLSGPLAYATAITPVADSSMPAYLLLAALGPTILFYAPALSLADRANRYHLYRPNPYIDVYDDPRSRHWLAARPVPADHEAAAPLVTPRR